MSVAVSIQIQYFNRVFDCWKAAFAHVDICFVSILVDGTWTLLSARVELSPFECATVKKDIVSTSQLQVGHIVAPMGAVDSTQLMYDIGLGKINILGLELRFPVGQDISIYAPPLLSEPDYYTHTLEVRQNSNFLLAHQFDYSHANAELRCGEVPFDGLVDLLSFFNWGNSGHLPHELKISVKMHPPGDLIVDKCSLTQNKLKLRLLRRTPFRREQVLVGLRQFPNPTVARRKQIGTQVVWGHAEGGFESGDLEMDLVDCANAEIMVSVEGYTVRRWFLLDPHKSLNPRLTDYRYLDPNLTQLRKYLTSPKDARQLEVGAAALLHLLGANSLNPPGTETPDVIVETWNKRLALVECTTKLEDVRAKTAKLVGRRDGLIATENKYGLNREVMAILLVNQPNSSLVNEQNFLLEHQVVLLTLEDINAALSNLEIPRDLDELYVAKMEAMRSTQLSLFSNLLQRP